MKLRFIYFCFALLSTNCLSALPIVSSVTYNALDGTLSITGNYFQSLPDPDLDIDATKISITGYEGVSFALNSAYNVDITSSESFSIVLTGTDKLQVNAILNRNGTLDWNNVSYQLNLADGWNCGLTGIADNENGIEVSGVPNHPPQVKNVNLSGDLFNGKNLSVSFEYFDFEDLPDQHIIRWYSYTNTSGAGKTLIQEGLSPSFLLSEDKIGLFINAEITPVARSGTSPGDQANSMIIGPVLNARPYVTEVGFSGNMYLSQALTGSYAFTDLENDDEGTSSFKWFRADDINGPDLEIAGENQKTYTITSADLNKYISFEVTPIAQNGTTQGDPVRSSRKAVLNEAPKGSSLTILNSRVLGQTVTSDYIYSDLENNSEGESEYQWFVADVVDGPDYPISGATGKTLEITRTYLGKYISFKVIPKALTGTTTGESVHSSRFYVNDAPNASNVTIYGIFKIKQELEGKFTYFDIENDPEAISEFHWFRSNTSDGGGKELIIGANTKYYTIQPGDMNKYISFEYTPKAVSGSLLGIPAAGPFMGPVANSEPIATNVRISGTQLVCKTLKGEYTFEDIEGDVEGDSQYRWLKATSVNGTKTPIPQATEREYTLKPEDQGMYIFFEVVPRAVSGTTTGAATTSSSTGSIVNILPSVTIFGTSSICSGSSARLTISFTGSAPWKLTYTDGTDQYQLVSSDPVYFLNVSKEGTYKGVTLEDNIGCPVTGLPSTATVSILKLPTVEIVGLNRAYNYRGNPVPLTGSPSGGTFSGPGVIPSTSMFYPSIAGTQNSPHALIYEYRAPQTGCVNRDTSIVEVIDADASISGFRNSSSVKYCNFDKPFVITGTNAVGATGSFAITGSIGLTDNSNNTATINPALLPPGSYTVSYSYFDGVLLTIYKDFTVEVLDEARVFGLNNNLYCSNTAPIELIGNYAGGVFSGNAVYKNVQTNRYYFNASLDLPGATSITYTYTTSYGCVVSKTFDKIIAPVPVAEFTVKNSCFNGDSTAFKNNTITAAGISKWEWQFGDPLSSEVNNHSVLFEPKHKYSAIGNRNVKLIAENIHGCSDTVFKTIHLGDIPKADFSWNSECFVKGNPLSFKSKSTNIDDITKYTWEIEDTSKLNFNYTSKDILHTFPIIRDFWVKLEVISEFGCSDSIKKIINLRPIHHLKDSVYLNNFEAGKGYWFPSDLTITNNWKWGTPDGNKINVAASGTKAYYTSLKGTRNNQQLVITSPCFNFKDTDRPFIILETFSDAMKGQEGAVLQYSVNDENWETVGGYASGLNWYNDFAIQSQPAGQQIGWSDKYTAWTNARHNLDFLRNDTLVRLRFVFGQNARAAGSDGFAVDNIMIANRSKNILLEHFTNNSQSESLKANAYLDSVVLRNKEDAVAIQYHTAFPGVDTFNIHNPSDPGSRLLYYGIGLTPLAILEGGTESEYVYDFNTRKPNSDDIKNMSMKDKSFDLGLRVTKTPSQVSGSFTIKALKNISGKNVTARIVVVESIVSQVGGYQVVYKNVVKKILPTAGGYTLPSSWSLGKTDSINFSWDCKNVYNSDNIDIVAFLQNEVSREIYQVTIDDTSHLTIGTGDKIKKTEKNWILNIFPNPAKDRITVDFPETESEDLRIEFWSMTGKVVLSEKLLKGITRYETDIQKLENGLYFVRILNRSRVLASKKLAIVH